MSRRILKIVLQVVGLLVGMFGWVVIVFGLLPFLPGSLPVQKLDTPIAIAFAGVGFLLGGVLCVIGHRTLFHFGPGSVRLLLGVLTYFLWSEVKLADSTSPVFVYVFPVSVIAAYVLYRIVAKYCCAFLFGAPAAEVSVTDTPAGSQP